MEDPAYLLASFGNIHWLTGEMSSGSRYFVFVLPLIKLTKIPTNNTVEAPTGVIHKNDNRNRGKICDSSGYSCKWLIKNRGVDHRGDFLNKSKGSQVKPGESHDEVKKKSGGS